MSRWIACLVSEAFAAEALRLRQPAYARQPLVIVSYGAKRATVAAASAEARQLGVTPGLPLSRARGLCPQAQVAAWDQPQGEADLNRLVEHLWTFSNRVEVDRAVYPQTAVCYLDFGSLHQSDAHQLAATLMETVRADWGLSVRVGVASGKLAARLAADCPDGPTVIAPGDQARFIAPFPVDYLPLSTTAQERLSLLGLRQIGQFAALPAAAVLAQFGSRGRTAYRLANGCDGRPVVPQRLPPTESIVHAAEEPITSTDRLGRIVHGLAIALERRLEVRAAAVHQLSLTLDSMDGTSQQEHLHLLEPAAAAPTIERTLHRLIERCRSTSGITRIDVRLTHLVSSQPRQLELFTAKPVRQQLIDLTTVLAARFEQVSFLEGEVAERDALVLEQRVRFRRVNIS